MNEDHMIIWQAEALALQPTAWEKWADAAEALLGHGLDGDQDTDGYSMDDAYDAFRLGWTPEEYADSLDDAPSEPYEDDVEHDAWVLASAGYGTDEDYGDCGDSWLDAGADW